MKRINKPLLLLGWLLWMAAGSGCTQTEVEEKEIPPHALKDVEVAFNLHVLANQTSPTRSASADTDTIPTRAGTDMENGLDSEIASLWVGQYNASGTLLYHYYNDNMTNNTINVKLKQNATGDDSKSHVWFVVNTGDLGEIATEDELKQHVLTYSHDNGLPSPRLCTMSGMWEGVVKEEGEASSITVNVTRLLAKIRFSYKINEATHAFSFMPDSIMLKSVPDRMQVASTQTQLAGVAYQTYKETDFTADAGGKVTKYWYLPENMAGTGDAVDAKKKKTGKGVTNATYVKLAGTAVQGGVTYKDVVFCFYPGKEEDDATVFNNYDIVRNSHYQMDVTLVGLDATDERITVGEIPPIEVTGGNMPAEKGGTKEVQITARPGQEWVFDLDLWLKATIEGKDAVTGAQITHQGPAKVTFEATEANPKAEQRSIEFSVNVGKEPQKFTITQEGSTLQKGDGITLEAASGSAGASSFTATKGLKWQLDRSTEDWWSWADGQATSGDDTQGTAAIGSPQVLNVKALSSNPSATPRTGTVTVKAGASTGPGYDGLIQEIPVTQAGSTVTGSTINDIAAEGATGDASFTATKGLNWTSAASGDWITLNSGASGSPTIGEPQNINYTVTLNPSSTARNGTITVQAGNTDDGPTGNITLNQSGATLSVSEATKTVAATASTTDYQSTFSATKGLSWNVSDNMDWLTLTSTTTGTNNTTGANQDITYSVLLNPNASTRAGNITVKAGNAVSGTDAGLTKTIAVTQEASSLTASINPATLAATKDASGTFTMKGTSGLSYSFTAGFPDWLTVTNGTASTNGGTTTGGDQTLTYKTASINLNASERSATVTVQAGNIPKSVTVKQAGSEFSTTNGAATIAVAGGSTTGSVKATTGLAWTITSSATNNGITVSPTSGSGTTTLTFTGTANTGAARTGTFTVSVTGASPARTASVTAQQEANITNKVTINSTVVESYKATTKNYAVYPPFNYDGGASSGTTGSDRNGVSSSCTLSKTYSIEVDKTEGPYSDHITAVTYCSNKGNGWRIPTMIELKAMYDDKTTLRNNGCAAFKNTSYWSSSVYSGKESYRCRILFGSGSFSSSSFYDPDTEYPGDSNYVRCVRDI